MPSTRRVLSTDLACTDYEALGAQLLTRCRQPGPYAVDFSNTHIVTMRQHDPAFAATTASIDLFVPDGMPLIWCLNRQGASTTLFAPLTARTSCNYRNPQTRALTETLKSLHVLHRLRR
jgi:UDP-N-acetyl-D-mannosaminuronic acid transferase (WecB/TagA/CpsF family)